MVFRVRSAKAVKITDATLLKRLGIICLCVGIGLLVRTIVAPPVVIVGRTADDLKAFLCKADWWDHTFTTSKLNRTDNQLIFYGFMVLLPEYCWLEIWNVNPISVPIMGLFSRIHDKIIHRWVLEII